MNNRWTAVGLWRTIGKSVPVLAYQTLMTLAATMHENSIFVLEQLCQLSEFCQLKVIIDFNDLSLMTLKPPLVPGTGF